MLEKLLRRFQRITNLAIEPLEGLSVQYQALIQAKVQVLQGVKFDLRQQTIEQYEKAGDSTKFHFISAVHSVYYLNDVDKSLMFLYNRLEGGGLILLIILSGGSNLICGLLKL